MEKKEMTNEQLSSVTCPTCGANIGEPCIWDFRGLRLGTHLNRELSVAAVIERNDTGVEAGNAMNSSDSAQPKQRPDPNFGRLTR